MIRICRLMIITTVLFTMAGCLSTTNQSSRAQDYTEQPKRLFVLTNIGSEFGTEYAEAFQSALMRIAKVCGTEVYVSFLNPTELDEGIHDRKQKAFNADTVLFVRRAGGTQDGWGLIKVIYDARMVDLTAKKTVWRSNMTFHRNRLVPLAKRGEDLAVDLTNQMKSDQIFPSCARIE